MHIYTSIGTRKDFFLHENWLLAWHSTKSDGQWEWWTLCVMKMKSRTGGGKGWHLHACDHCLSTRSLRIKPQKSWAGRKQKLMGKKSISNKSYVTYTSDIFIRFQRISNSILRIYLQYKVQYQNKSYLEVPCTSYKTRIYVHSMRTLYTRYLVLRSI